MELFFYGMTQFDIFLVFVEKSVNSELCFFWALLKPTKIWNLYPKMPMFEQLKKQVPVNSKNVLTPHQKDIDMNFLEL